MGLNTSSEIKYRMVEPSNGKKKADGAKSKSLEEFDEGSIDKFARRRADSENLIIGGMQSQGTIEYSLHHMRSNKKK